MGAAIVAAERLNAIAKEDKPKQAGKLNLSGRLFSHVCQSYMQTHQYKDKKPRTKQGYRNDINRINQVFGDIPVNQIKRHHIKEYWCTLKENNGHATANSIITVFRIVLNHAVEMEWIAINPAAKQKITSVPIQVIYHTPDECSAMVDMADSMGEFGIGDAIILAIHTGQRQSDILKMQPSLLKNGKMQIRQSQDKTGSLVDFPATSMLQTRIKQAMLRNGVLTVETTEIVLFDIT